MQSAHSIPVMLSEEFKEFKEFEEFRSAEMQECGSTGVQEYRSAEAQTAFIVTTFTGRRPFIRFLRLGASWTVEKWLIGFRLEN
jgi:hypothetical protein